MTTPTTETSGIHLWLVLMKAYQALQHRALGSIGNTGLCFSDFAVLEALLHKGPMPVNTVGAKVALTSGASTAAIDRLEKKGLVRRALDTTDRRARIVHLTAQGTALIEAAFRKHADDMESVAAGLAPQERKHLLNLLKRFGSNAVADSDVHSSSPKG